MKGDAGMTGASPTPTTIRELQRAAYPGHALLAGIQLDIFLTLAGGQKSADDVARSLSLDSEKLGILM